MTRGGVQNDYDRRCVDRIAENSCSAFGYGMRVSDHSTTAGHGDMTAAPEQEQVTVVSQNACRPRSATGVRGAGVERTDEGNEGRNAR